jgi:hypothetical protein
MCWGRSHAPGRARKRRACGGFVRLSEKLSFPTASRKSLVLLALRARRWITRSNRAAAIRKFPDLARPPRDNASPFGKPGLSERPVRADATGSVNLSDNQAVRLIHRERPREDSLEEGKCYDHSYREHMSDHVEVVPLEPAGIRVETPAEVETEHHVTTERLKGQFEQRLAARKRRSRRTRP